MRVCGRGCDEVKSRRHRIKGQNRPRFPKSTEVHLGNLFTSAVLVLTVCLLGPNKGRKICSEFHQKHKQTLGNVCCWFLSPPLLSSLVSGSVYFIKHTHKAPTLSCVLTNASEGTGGRWGGVPPVISYPGPNPRMAGEPQCKKWPSTDLPRPWPLARPLTDDHSLD